MVVAHFRDVFFATGHLPDLGPKLFFFQFVEIPRDPAVYAYILIAHIGVGVFPQVGWYFDGFIV